MLIIIVSRIWPPPSVKVDVSLTVNVVHPLFAQSQSLLFLHRGWFARALRDYPDEPLRSKSSQSYVAELEYVSAVFQQIPASE